MSYDGTLRGGPNSGKYISSDLYEFEVFSLPPFGTPGDRVRLVIEGSYRWDSDDKCFRWRPAHERSAAQ